MRDSQHIKKTSIKNGCEHGIKRKSNCPKCNPKIMCSHDRERRNCKECGGSNICVHSKIKRFCRECNKKMVCTHGFVKIKCKLCNPKITCVHGCNKYSCKKCKVSTSQSFVNRSGGNSDSFDVDDIFAYITFVDDFSKPSGRCDSNPFDDGFANPSGDNFATPFGDCDSDSFIDWKSSIPFGLIF